MCIVIGELPRYIRLRCLEEVFSQSSFGNEDNLETNNQPFRRKFLRKCS